MEPTRLYLYIGLLGAEAWWVISAVALLHAVSYLAVCIAVIVMAWKVRH